MDAHEIIAQLKADPALLAEVRAVVLTEELLAVPARLERLEAQTAALVAAVDQLRAVAEEHTRQMAAAAARFDQVDAQMAELRSMFGRFMRATGDALERIETKIDEQGHQLDEHGRKLDEHGRRLEEHGRKLDEHGRKIDQQGMRLARIEEHLE